MKTVITFLVGAVIGFAGIYLYHKLEAPESKTKFALDLNVSNGQRVPLKPPTTVADFEKLLQDIDPNGDNGTIVNIKPESDQPAEVEGPLAGGIFKAPNRLMGPRGSIHNTQKINFSTLDQVQRVLNVLEINAANTVPSATAPTP